MVLYTINVGLDLIPTLLNDFIRNAHIAGVSPQMVLVVTPALLMVMTFHVVVPLTRYWMTYPARFVRADPSVLRVGATQLSVADPAQEGKSPIPKARMIVRMIA